MVDNTQNNQITQETKDLIGARVYDSEGLRIGNLDDVIERDGRILAVLDLSHHTGSEESLYAVAWENLDIEHEDGPRTAIEIDEEVLENARALHEQDFEDVTVDDWNTSIFIYMPQVHWPS